MTDLRLNVILDGGPGRDLPALARAAAEGGATLLQYRDKTAATRLMIANAAAILDALAGTGIALVVNDRVDVALAAGAAGVHLGRDDMDPATARALLGPDAIVGVTVKTEADAVAAVAAPADYACIGGVFSTISKHNPDPPVGLEGLRALRAILSEARPALPVGAIAGIDLGKVPAVVAAGADGVAVISAVLAAADPRAAAAQLRAAVDAALSERRR